jgi:beta-lactamase class D
MKKITFCFFMLLSFSTFGQSNFQKYFDSLSVSGSTTIFDYKNKKWMYSDSTDAFKQSLPASTFKILHSLIALETKVLKDENEVIKWDGINKDFFGAKMDIWNKDTDLKTAYKNSTVWFYVEIAKRLGKKKYKKYLKKCTYGNLNFTEHGTDFWNYGDYGISPKEQIEFLIKLNENKLPFSPTTLDKVKQIMISEQNEKFTFRDKTGWTKKNGIDIGWWVGYVQTMDNIYFFATRLTKPVDDKNPNFSKARKEITKQILNEIKAI